MARSQAPVEPPIPGELFPHYGLHHRAALICIVKLRAQQNADGTYQWRGKCPVCMDGQMTITAHVGHGTQATCAAHRDCGTRWEDWTD